MPVNATSATGIGEGSPELHRALLITETDGAGTAEPEVREPGRTAPERRNLRSASRDGRRRDGRA